MDMATMGTSLHCNRQHWAMSRAPISLICSKFALFLSLYLADGTIIDSARCERW